ncbi:MAG: class I SAM-dependent methyltransferase, partial [Candidatus Omnitrophica bacterium]|nr:class I SAM-dependent methyltransferase [Candidatus Omnitrophota bacterium]
DPEKVEKSSFDVVIVANVMHHVVPEKRIVFFRTVKKLLNPDGLVFVFEHNPYNPLTQFVVKRSVLDREASLLTLEEVEKGLTRTGISVILKKYIVFFPRCLKALRCLEPALGTVPMGAQYVCVGRKLS